MNPGTVSLKTTASAIHGNICIETAVIAVTFRGAYLAATGGSERVGRPQYDSRHVFPELPLLQHTQTGGKVAVSSTGTELLCAAGNS